MSPFCDVNPVIVAVPGVVVVSMFPTVTISPPDVESVSLIIIQFVLLPFVPNTSLATVVVNDTEPPVTTPPAAIILFVSKR